MPPQVFVLLFFWCFVSESLICGCIWLLCGLYSLQQAESM